MIETMLIVGGTGFIGSHLASLSKKRGFRTIVLSFHMPCDNDRIVGVDYVQADIANITDLKNKLKEPSIDYVINLGGYIDHSVFLNGGREVIDIHFNGVVNLIEVLDWSQLKRFVQIGSSDEYGNQSAPQEEGMSAYPISPYSFGKSASAQFLQMLFRTESFPATILRLFLVYGPGQNGKRFLPQIIQGCLTDSTFPVSSGDQLRDFCYVEDIVEAIFLSLESDIVNGHIINLGSGNPVSIREMIEYVKTTIGYGNPEFGKIPYRRDESMELYADVSKARRLLGWEQKVDFEVGMNKTIDYYRKVHS